ncbi:MAG: HmuY family protein, partial [Endomicrobiia bacterium]|nr:HmuY family protein [Endomicrobiia bacterium]
EKFKDEENIVKTGLKSYLAQVEAIKSEMQAVYSRKPEELPTDPATAAYFIKGKKPRLDYEKLERELNQTLTKKGNFDYFSDGNRDFYCDSETENLRQKIAAAKGEIYKISWDSGAAFEPASVETLYIDNRQIAENIRYDATTIYRAERQSDSIEIRGTVDKPQNARDIEISLDGGAIYKKGVLTLSGKNFQGKIDLVPARTVEIKLKINSARGDDFAVYPRFGQGVEIFYSTEDPSRDVKEAIDELIASYESESPFAFMRGVSENFLGGYATMERAVRADFAKFDAIRMKIYTDKITLAPSREQAVADVRWERSWFDTSANKIVGAQGGANTFRMEKTGGRWKLLSYSGTPVFGMAATSGIDSPTGIVVTSGGGGGVVADDGGEITPAALPVRTGQVLTNHWTTGAFFSFHSGRESVSGEYDLDFVGIPNFTQLRGAVYDYGAVSLDSVTEAPTLGYASGVDAIVNRTYVVKCQNGNYVKLRITYMDNTLDGYGNATSMTFDWAYQPDGSRNIR